jgi:formamidopyrimidine-DNA glycosylase
MPELPEVQTIVNDLNNKLKNDKIIGFWTEWRKSIKNISKKGFVEDIKDRKILNVRRLGKSILIDLSKKNSSSKKPEKTLYIHLKMTGHLLVRGEVEDEKDFDNYFEEKVNKYVRHSWKLRSSGGKIRRLNFSDVRKFAKIMLVKTEDVGDLAEISRLGIDALDKRFNLKRFKEILNKKKKVSIGKVLMDQEVIAGIGNIYRSEILFESCVDPEKLSGDLKEKEIGVIYKNIKNTLRKALRMRGTSDSDYRDTSGAPGRFQKVLKVYRRAGKECEKCGSIVEGIKIAQRSVFICPKCQK